MFPKYKESFDLKEISSNYSEIYAPNRGQLLRVIFITLMLVMAFIGGMSLHEMLPDSLFATMLVLVVISCLTTIMVALRRPRWVLFKHRSGVYAFLIGNGGNGVEKMNEFCQQVRELVEANDDTPNDRA